MQRNHLNQSVNGFQQKLEINLTCERRSSEWMILNETIPLFALKKKMADFYKSVFERCRTRSLFIFFRQSITVDDDKFKSLFNKISSCFNCFRWRLKISTTRINNKAPTTWWLRTILFARACATFNAHQLFELISIRIIISIMHAEKTNSKF